MPSLIAHGGAGGRAPAGERAARKQGMLTAVRQGAEILRNGGSALDAVVAGKRPDTNQRSSIGCNIKWRGVAA